MLISRKDYSLTTVFIPYIVKSIMYFLLLHFKYSRCILQKESKNIPVLTNKYGKIYKQTAGFSPVGSLTIVFTFFIPFFLVLKHHEAVSCTHILTFFL